MVHLQLIFPVLHPSGLSCGSVPQWHHCLLIVLPRLRASSELFLLVTLWWLPGFSFCFKVYLFLLCSASLYPGSWVASRLDYFIFKTFFCPRTSKYICTLQLSAVICSMGADLNLLTLRAQHWICLEVTQPQQFIPYSSYEDSSWSFACANIRAASGASSTSSNATTSPPRIFPLCSYFGLLLYFHLHSPLTLFSFLAPRSKTASASCVSMDLNLYHRSYRYVHQSFNLWLVCSLFLEFMSGLSSEQWLEIMRFTVSGCWGGVVVLFHPVSLCLCLQ